MKPTRRQELAQSLAEQLVKLGRCYVTSSLPLNDDRPLRFEVISDSSEAILNQLASWGWKARPCGAGERFVLTGNAALPQAADIFELDLPRERKPADGKKDKSR
jgi:hypothetical protein